MADTNQDNNFVAHCYEDGHDKIYISVIRKTPDGYAVVGKWGRRGRNVSEQTKGVYATHSQARNAAMSLFDAKLNKGYVDILSGGYYGELSFKHPDVNRYLEPLVVPVVSPQPELSPEPKQDPNEEFIVRCLSNETYEKQFDVGVEYIARVNPEDDKFYIVCDKCAVERVVFKILFIKCAG